MSAYDALVTLARKWKKRYPLVDFIGNVGNIDGDGPAAMRYTECHLSKIGESMLDGINKNTVPMIPNYDNTTKEPTILSGLFPQLLCNGNEGVATGFACALPPHYANDVFKAINKMLDSIVGKEEISEDDIINIIKAPDFPTGATIINPAEVREAYKNGFGRVRIRSKYEIEHHQGKQWIIFTEIPYNVNKSDLIASIGDKVFNDAHADKALSGNVSDVADESAKGNIRIVVKLKKNANLNIVLNNLFKKTLLESSYSINNTVIANGRPIQHVSLFNLVKEYCKHQLKVKFNATKYDAQQYIQRIEILNGFIKIESEMDSVIETIRQSDDHEAVIKNLMDNFELTERQAKAIDAKKLGSLNKLDVDAYHKEAKDLNKKIAACKKILSSKEELIKALKKDIEAYIARGYFKNDKRHTEIEILNDSADERDLVEEENIVMVYTHNGMLKAVNSSEYNTQGRAGIGTDMKLREDDFVEQLLNMSNHDDIVIVTNKGRGYSIPAYRIPIVSKSAVGKYLSNYVEMQNDERVVRVMAIPPNHADGYLALVSKNGYAKRMPLEELQNISRRNGLSISKVSDDDEIVACFTVSDKDEIIAMSCLGMALRTPANNIGIMGRTARGSILMRFKKEDDSICSVVVAKESDDLLVLTANGLGKRIEVSTIPSRINRGGKGVAIYKPEELKTTIIATFVVDPAETVFISTTDEKLIRIPAESIRKTGRTAKGTKLIKLSKGASIASATCGPNEEKKEEEG